MAANSPARNRFQKLVEDISSFYLTAKESQVRFAWDSGRRIVEEEQNGSIRAQYGTRLILELSNELSRMHGPGFSQRTLHNMRRFYQLNPILQHAAKLSWSDCVELMPVKDKKARKRLAARIVKEKLNRGQLRRAVRAIRHSSGQTEKDPAEPSDLPPLKCPADLRLNTFSMIADDLISIEQGEVLIDCGFFVNLPVKKDALHNSVITDKPSYTYAAKVERVVDGDTLRVVIDLGFRVFVREKLRLRGIDAPELGTPEGDQARKYVFKLLPPGSMIVLKSHKCRIDRYGRFLADVFYSPGAEDAADVLARPVYLNQHLLDEGYARRMGE